MGVQVGRVSVCHPFKHWCMESRAQVIQVLAVRPTQESEDYKGEGMTLQEQLEQAKAQLKEINAGRPKVYRAWDDTFATFHEDPAAFHKAHDSLYSYDTQKNKVLDEVIRLRALVEDPDVTAAKVEIKTFLRELHEEKV